MLSQAKHKLKFIEKNLSQDILFRKTLNATNRITEWNITFCSYYDDTILVLHWSLLKDDS